MPILGAHMSIAGGYYKSVEAAARCECDCVQLFTKNNNQWRAKPISAEDATRFQASLSAHGIKHPIAHNCYLINLASPDDALWQKSVDAMAVELTRAEQLGIPYVVSHPGSYTTSSEDAGIRRVVQAIDEIHHRLPDIQTMCLLENTAGQGTNLGWKFEHLAQILDGVREPERLGVCLDTCHTFAAGYPMDSRRDYLATMREFGKTVGFQKLKAIHLNDSKKPLGSRVDRHAHIGRGEMGTAPFRHLLNDRRLRKVPMYLETPKGMENRVELDVINLRTLRSLIE